MDIGDMVVIADVANGLNILTNGATIQAWGRAGGPWEAYVFFGNSSFDPTDPTNTATSYFDASGNLTAADIASGGTIYANAGITSDGQIDGDSFSTNGTPGGTGSNDPTDTANFQAGLYIDST